MYFVREHLRPMSDDHLCVCIIRFAAICLGYLGEEMSRAIS